MGVNCSSVQQWVVQLIFKMHKVLVASCLAAAALADAEPGYLGLGYGYGYGLGGVSTGLGLHPTGSVYESRSAQGLGKRSADAEPGYYTQNYWPSVSTSFGSSTCYGCRGKRSAEPGYNAHGYAYGYNGDVSSGVGLHSTGSVYESRSAQGLGKRSAEPGYLGYGLSPYGYAIGAVSTGVGLHSTGSVYESRSAQGLGKRS